MTGWYFLELANNKVQAYIHTYEDSDPARLALTAKRDQHLPIQLIAAQIKSRQLAKRKLPELYQKEGVIFPHGVPMEQCSSELTAKYKATIVTGNSLTDLTGGFGIDAFYFSKVIENVVHVEQNAELSALVKHNSTLLELPIKCIYATAEEYLSSIEEKPADTYYLDPARRDANDHRVFMLQDCQPDLTSILPEIHKRKANCLIKVSPMLDIERALTTLPNVSEIHVVSVRNECKELLFLLDSKPRNNLTYHCVNIVNEYDREEFTISNTEENTAVCKFGEVSTYLYEPNASIMKASLFNSLAKRFDLVKLHRNSHLYTSDLFIEDFPGRAFRVIKKMALSKKSVRSEIPTLKANLTVRNYPMTVAQIRKQIGLKEGGDDYIFATTLITGEITGVLCEKIV